LPGGKAIQSGRFLWGKDVRAGGKRGRRKKGESAEDKQGGKFIAENDRAWGRVLSKREDCRSIAPRGTRNGLQSPIRRWHIATRWEGPQKRSIFEYCLGSPYRRRAGIYARRSGVREKNLNVTRRKSLPGARAAAVVAGGGTRQKRGGLPSERSPKHGKEGLKGSNSLRIEKNKRAAGPHQTTAGGPRSRDI